MNDFSLTEEKLFDLQALHREVTEMRQACRFKAFILLRSGWTLIQVILIDRTTVLRYFPDYKQAGGYTY